jgi:hypothetical protein
MVVVMLRFDWRREAARAAELVEAAGCGGAGRGGGLQRERSGDEHELGLLASISPAASGRLNLEQGAHAAQGMGPGDLVATVAVH